jgi:hemerythrin
MRYQGLNPASPTSAIMLNMLRRNLSDALQCAARASDAEFNERFHALVDKIEATFSTEEKWMERMELPTVKAYREQHARVLMGLHHAHAALMNGSPASSRRAVNSLLPLWLVMHFAGIKQAVAARADLGGLGPVISPRPRISRSWQLGQ